MHGRDFGYLTFNTLQEHFFRSSTVHNNFFFFFLGVKLRKSKNKKKTKKHQWSKICSDLSVPPNAFPYSTKSLCVAMKRLDQNPLIKYGLYMMKRFRKRLTLRTRYAYVLRNWPQFKECSFTLYIGAPATT